MCESVCGPGAAAMPHVSFVCSSINQHHAQEEEEEGSDEGDEDDSDDEDGSGEEDDSEEEDDDEEEEDAEVPLQESLAFGREKRATQGKRMGILVGEEQEKDDEFWGDEKWKEDEAESEYSEESGEQAVRGC